MLPPTFDWRRGRDSTPTLLSTAIGLFLLLRLGVDLVVGARSCLSNICFNNGTCVIEERDGRPPSFNCICPPSFTGVLCEQALPQTTRKSATSTNADCQRVGCPDGEICLLNMSTHVFGCEHDLCRPTPCLNNATCRPISGAFVCECSREFTGSRCERRVADCATAQPCMHGGRCVDVRDGGWRCECSPPWSGTICEQKTGFCGQHPCGANGRCEELAVGFRCLCDADHEGERCERRRVSTVVCEKPRELIEIGDGQKKCVCPISKKAECDADTAADMKSSSTQIDCTVEGRRCLNGGVCVRRDDDQTMFCKCVPPHTGTHCDKMTPSDAQIDETEQPTTTTIVNNPIGALIPSSQMPNVSSCDECAHALKCLRLDGRLQCLCEPEFAGSLCAERADACANMRCTNNHICRLRRSVSGDIPYCSCPDETSGVLCQQKAPAVTFSPFSVALVQPPTPSPNSPHTGFSLELSFRTTLADVHIVSGETLLGESNFAIGLVDGVLALTLADGRRRSLSNESEPRLNDASWYSIAIAATSNVDETLIELTDDETGYLLLSRVVDGHTFDVFALRFGRRAAATTTSSVGGGGESASGEVGASFSGCLRAVRVNRVPVDLAAKGRSIGLTVGCGWRPQCAKTTCGAHGTCVELWNGTRCECESPFLAPDCKRQLQEATFGHANESSRLELALDRGAAAAIETQTAILLRTRTNKPNGGLFRLYSADAAAADDETATFLAGELHEGRLEIVARLGGRRVERVRGRRRVDDNSVHAIAMQRDGNTIELLVDGERDARLVLDRPFTHPLLINRLVFGSSVAAVANSSDELFKGTLQDARLNGQLVVLQSPAPADIKQPQLAATRLVERNVLLGTVSDDLCALWRPCGNDNRCELTFNDFVCHCVRGRIGRRCDIVDFCSSAPCPTSAQCSNTHHGYVCTSPATLAPTSLTRYALVQPVNTTIDAELSSATRFSFALRTRTPVGHVFSMSDGHTSIGLRIADRTANVYCRRDNLTTDNVRHFDVSNGQWHVIELQEQTTANGKHSIVVRFDNKSAFDGDHETPLQCKFSLARFRQASDSWLAFGRSQDEDGFKGCVHAVRFGGLPELSFYSSDVAGTQSLATVAHLEARIQHNVRPDGCHSRDLCARATNPCRNGATCRDLFNTFQCECEQPFAGEFCERRVGTTARSALAANDSSIVDVEADEEAACALVCVHGRCRGAVCECDRGWTGVTCDVDRDECVDDPPCYNGTCTNTVGSYSCSCPEFLMGENCEIVGECAHAPCTHGRCDQLSAHEFRCDCANTFYRGERCAEEIDFCASGPCSNGATCERRLGGFTCHCADGFEGERCEIDIDECAANACENGGRCIDRVAAFECDCAGTGYEGLLCTDDIDECADPQANCLHGDCTNAIGSYQCSCHEGHIGKRCHIDDPCSLDANNQSLSNCVHGVCTNAHVIEASNGMETVLYDCSCHSNYAGPYCSHRAHAEKQIAIGYVLGPVAALVVVSVLLGSMLFFFVARNRRANQGTYSPSTQEMNGSRVPMHNLQHPLKKQERLI